MRQNQVFLRNILQFFFIKNTKFKKKNNIYRDRSIVKEEEFACEKKEIFS